MLANVLPRSLPVGFQLLKNEGPNGELVPVTDAKGLRCGIEPALSLDRSAEALEPSLLDG